MTLRIRNTCFGAKETHSDKLRLMNDVSNKKASVNTDNNNSNTHSQKDSQMENFKQSFCASQSLLFIILIPLFSIRSFVRSFFDMIK